MKNIKKIFLIAIIILLGIGSQTFAESGYAVSFGLNENLFQIKNSKCYICSKHSKSFCRCNRYSK